MIWGYHYFWKHPSVMSCSVMFHTPHTSIFPKTGRTRRTHWGFSIWGPSPLPDTCKALKAQQKSPKSEIRFQKQTEKASKIYGFNLLIYDCFMPQSQNSTEFSKHLICDSTVVQLRCAHSRFARIPLQCPCAAVVASKAIETNQQNRFMFEFRRFSR